MRNLLVAFFLFSFVQPVLAHEITVYNYSGTNVVAGPLTFPVGKSVIEWPYPGDVFSLIHNGNVYEFPVTNDFQITVDATDVYFADVTSTTQWFTIGFGLATSIAGFFWLLRIINQIGKASPEVT